MKNYKVVELFAIPVFKSTIDLNDEILKIVELVPLKRMKANNGFSSVNKKILLLPEFDKIKEQICNQLGFYLEHILKVKQGTSFGLQNSWVVKHQHKDWAQVHDHVNSVISGIVYLKTNPNSGDLIFHKDRMWQNIFPRSTTVEFDEFSTITASEWKFTPEVGEIYFFPSFLAHQVTENLNQEDRYSLAFNFYPRGKLGYHEDSLSELDL
jgi:uncharacterized protein (TIGR02466 family)